MKMLPAVRALVLTNVLTVAVLPLAAEQPLTPARQALDRLHTAIRQADAQAAQQAYAQLGKDFAGTDTADEASWEYACFLTKRGQFDQAQQLLVSLRQSGRENLWVSQALLGLADVAQRRGDEKAMLAYLEEALQAKPAPKGRNCLVPFDPAQVALPRLAEYYRDKGDYRKAIHYFSRWKPRSFCGTCMQLMERERDQEIALC